MPNAFDAAHAPVLLAESVAALAIRDGGVYVEGMVQMKAGDVCEVVIDGLGILSNPVVADAKAEYQTTLFTPR